MYGLRPRVGPAVRGRYPALGCCVQGAGTAPAVGGRCPGSGVSCAGGGHRSCFGFRLFRSGHWALGLSVSCCPQFAPTVPARLFLVPYSFFAFCCWRRCVSRCKHCSEGPKDPQREEWEREAEREHAGPAPGTGHGQTLPLALAAGSPARRPGGRGCGGPGPPSTRTQSRPGAQQPLRAAPRAPRLLCLSTPHNVPGFSKMQESRAASVFLNQISHT